VVDARAHAMAKNMEVASMSAQRDRYAEEVRAMESYSKNEASDHAGIVSALRLELRAQAKQLVEHREEAEVARLHARTAQESERDAARSLRNQTSSMKEMQISLMIVTQEKIALQEEKQRLNDFISLKAEDRAPLKEELKEQSVVIKDLHLKTEHNSTPHAIKVAQMAAQIEELHAQLKHAGGGAFVPEDFESGADTQRSEIASSSEVWPSLPLNVTHLTCCVRQATPRHAAGNLLAAAAMLEEGFTGTSDLDLDNRDDGAQDTGFLPQTMENLQRASMLVAASGGDDSFHWLPQASPYTAGSPGLETSGSLTRRLAKTTSERKKKHEADQPHAYLPLCSRCHPPQPSPTCHSTPTHDHTCPRLAGGSADHLSS